MPDPEQPALTGRVVASTGSWYHVETPEGRVQARMRGRFRQGDFGTTNPVAVGDIVELTLGDDGTGAIERILPRTTQLSRRAAGRRVGIEAVIAANVSRAWCVQSVALPGLNPGLVDRFLVTAARDEIPAGVIVNKVDLLDDLDADDEPVRAAGWFVDLYGSLGYPVVEVSARDGRGLDRLRELLRDEVSVVSGPSGVGKSSLLNALAPELSLRTGAVSTSTGKGKHTTTNAALYPLSFGGYLVDTPGIREFGVTGLEPHDLGHYFAEFVPLLPDCRFPTCTHDHEPDCAVKAAVEAGDVSHSRYLSYLSILEGLRAGDRDVGR